MSGKSITFKKEVMSPVFGEFKAGDVAKNVDPAFAADMIAAGAARETPSGAEAQKKASDEAADEAGRLTDRTAAEPSSNVERHNFTPVDDQGMQRLGVLPTAPAVAGKPGDADLGTHGKGAAPADSKPDGVKTPAVPVRREKAPAAAKAAQATKAAPGGAKSVDAPVKAAKGGAGARMAATGTKAGGK